jgi:alpha-glucosidase (family GH31 glycosyl hydrolase)
VRGAGRARRASLLLVTILIASVAGATPASGQTLRSGRLEARITAEPFALEFVDLSDGDKLRTVDAGAPRPDDPRAKFGPLGYSFDLRVPVLNNAILGYYQALESETAWFQATRVLSSRRDGEALVLELGTNDPLGHTLELKLAPAGEGGITASSRIATGPFPEMASVSGAAFRAVDGERYLGFGERSNAVDQTGGSVFSWAEEGPFSSGNYEDELRPLLPDFTFPTGPTASNFPMPWLVSTRGFGLLIDQSERSTFDLARERPDAWRAQAESARFRVTVFAGPRPADTVRRYSAYAGRQPPASPWFFGPWFQPTEEKRPYELAERFRAEDVPVTVAQTYTHYLPCGDHRGREQTERERIARYHELGFKITTYFNPHVCTSYEPVYSEAAEEGLLVKNAAGEPYVLTNPFTADEQISEIDFTNPAGRALFARLLDDAINAGYDGWMEDFGEYTPFDSVFANGETGRTMHNRYPVEYHGASTEHTSRRGGDFAVFIRSGFHGVQPHARVVWGGDPTEDWSCSDGICAAVHQLLSIGLSGIAYQGSDIGGFHSVVNPRTDDELNARWLQVGAVSGVMRTQANGFSFRSDRAQRSQVWSPAVLPIWRRYAKLRTQLYPYIAAASAEYQRTGMPIARHLSLAFPEDARAVRQQHEFMFGPDLLAAPVLRPGARERELYLPPGRWVDLWRAVAYDPARGSLRLGRATVLEGGREVKVPAPLEELPLMVRAGALIPLVSSDVDTIADGGSGAGLVHLRDRRRQLRIIAFPRGRSRASLGPGIRAGSVTRRRRWTLRIRSSAKRRYRLQASLATLRRPFRPRCVTVRGRRLTHRRWRYDRASRVLRAAFKLRSGGLVVARRCRG